MRLVLALLALLLAGCSSAPVASAVGSPMPPRRDGHYRTTDGKWAYAETERWTINGQVGWIQRSGFGNTPAEALAACRQTGGLRGKNGSR